MRNTWWPVGLFILIAALVYLSSPLWAADVRVIDGDTVHIDGEKIRLSGIDTPEKGHQAECLAERMLSALATARLNALLAGAEVRIEREGVDRYGRTLAKLYARGEDVAGVLISEGLGRPWRGRQEDWCR